MVIWRRTRWRIQRKALVRETGTAVDQEMPVIAVENGGGIRAAVTNGNITLGELVSTFPFSNTVYMKKYRLRYCIR